MSGSRLRLERDQILAFRREAAGLTRRLAPGPSSLRRSAWVGHQDSVPRSALHSIHARVEHTRPETWEDRSLVQVWGPRFTAYVVADRDRAVFTLGRHPDRGSRLRRAEDTADRLGALLDGEEMTYRDAGRALGVDPNALRYAATTGTVLLRWEGSGQPTVRSVPAPDLDPREARLELARRHLHVLGPSTADSFGAWAGIVSDRARSIFDALAPSLVPVRTPIGDAWILAEDEPAFTVGPGSEAPPRLLPSGDAHFLVWGADRQLLVPEGELRRELWPSRVWPGALLVEGEIVGTWRRSRHTVTVRCRRHLSDSERDAVEAEAATLPLPGIAEPVVVRWAG